MKKLIFLIGIIIHSLSFSQVIEPYIAANKIILDSAATDSTYGAFWADGNNLYFYGTDGWQTLGGGGSGTPGGSDTEIQFNNAGAFDGDPAFKWNNTTSILELAGDFYITGDIDVTGNIDADTAFIPIIQADKIGVGDYDINASIVGTDTLVLDGDTITSISGGSSYWDLDVLSLIPDTANSDSIRLPDGYLGVGERNLNDGRIDFHTGNYDIAPLSVYNFNNKLAISGDIVVGNSTSNYAGIESQNGSTSGTAHFRSRASSNYGFGGNYLQPEIIVNGTWRVQCDSVTRINDVLMLVPRASAPSNPVEGWIYSNSADNHLYFYNGTSWVQLDN